MKTHKALWAALFLGLIFGLLSGCGSTGKDLFSHQDPKIGPAPQPRAGAASPNKEALPCLDPEIPLTLDRATSLALAQNPRIRLALGKAGISEDAVDMAVSQYYPFFEIIGGYHARNNDPGLYFPESGMGMISGEKQGVMGSVMARYLLTDFGGRHFRVRAARLDAAVARITSLKEYHRITLEVAEAYFNLLAASHFFEVATDSHKLYQEQVRLSTSLFDHEMVAKNDVLTARIGLAQARQTLITAENNIVLARAALNFLMGADIDSPCQIKDVKSVPSMPLDYTQCLLTAVDHRPELKALKKEKARALANVGIVKASFAPVLVGEAGYKAFSDDYMLNKDYVTAGVFLQWDIIKGGKVPAQIRQARRFVRLVEDKMQLTGSAVALEVKSAFLRSEENRKKIKVAEKAVAQARENLRIYQDQYAQSLVSITDLLAAQTLLTKSRFEYLDVLYGYHKAMARLENAVGTRVWDAEDARKTGEEEDNP